MSVSGEQEFTTEIAASVQQCFETITSFERYPEWFSGIDAIKVLERYPNGLGKHVEFSMNMMLKRIRYVLAYEYDKPTELRWHSIDGDIQSVSGRYNLKKLSPTTTAVSCRQAISVGFWVPGPMRKLLEQTALRQSVLEFKAAAEAQSVASAKPRKKKST